MDNSLKYDPLRTFRTGSDKSRAIESLMSMKIETDLEEKIKNLLKDLITSEDTYICEQLSIEIKNILKDIEDLKRTREITSRRMNEGNQNV
jgi:hypothetical protein